MFARRASLDLGVVPVVVVSPDGVGGGRVGCGVWIVVRDSSRRELLRWVLLSLRKLEVSRSFIWEGLCGV